MKRENQPVLFVLVVAAAASLALIACGGSMDGFMEAADELTRSAGELAGFDEEAQQEEEQEGAQTQAAAQGTASAEAPQEDATGAGSGGGGGLGMMGLPSIPGVEMSVNEGGDHGGSSGQTWCCVNRAYYDCSDVAKAAQCLGEPMRLVDCLGQCSGADGRCEDACIEQHGPDPSECRRDMSRDADCSNG